MSLVSKVKSVFGLDSKKEEKTNPEPASQQQSRPAPRKRERTPNQHDFNELRAATIEVVHPTQPEPWLRERSKDGVVEEYRRMLDEDLPLAPLASLLAAKTHTFRVFFNALDDGRGVEVELKPDGTIVSVVLDRSGPAPFKQRTEVGTWAVEPVDIETIARHDDYYGDIEVAVPIVRYRGRSFTSEHFIGYLRLKTHGLQNRKGEVKDFDVRYPIYQASVQRIQRDRDTFLARLDKRDTCSAEWLESQRVRKPFMNCHEGYLLRPNRLHDTPHTRFKYSEVSEDQFLPVSETC